MEDEDIVDPKFERPVTGTDVLIVFAVAVWVAAGLFLSMFFPFVLLFLVAGLLIPDLLWSTPPLAYSLAGISIVGGFLLVRHLYDHQEILLRPFIAITARFRR